MAYIKGKNRAFYLQKTITGIYGLTLSHNSVPKLSKQVNKELMLLSHLRGFRPLSKQQLSSLKVQAFFSGGIEGFTRRSCHTHTRHYKEESKPHGYQ